MDEEWVLSLTHCLLTGFLCAYWLSWTLYKVHSLTFLLFIGSTWRSKRG